MVYIRAVVTVTSITPIITLPTSTRRASVTHNESNRPMTSVATSSSNRLLDYLTLGNTVTTTSLTDDSDADVGEATSVQDVAASSDTPTDSIIQITALPPATTAPQDVAPKVAYERQFDIIYLTPLFVVLGVVLGVVVAILLLKWRTRRQRLRRSSTLQPGPPYVPPENDVEDRLLVHGSQSMEEVSLFAAGTPSKFTVHGSRYTPKRNLAWPTFLKDQPPSYSQPSYAQTIVPSMDGERFTVLVQDDPFLVTPSRGKEQSSSDLSSPRIPMSPSIQKASTGNYPDRHEDLNPGSPKPFRRSMVDMLKLRSTYQPVPKAHSESKTTRVSSPSGNTAVARWERLSLEGSLAASDTWDRLVDMTEAKQGVRGLEISPKRGMHPEEAALISPKRTPKPRIVTPYPSETEITLTEPENANDTSEYSVRGEQVDEEQARDIYTKAPQRRRSRRPSQKSTTGTSRSFSAPDAHAAVLPVSPPALMSPPLEQFLFFTSPLSSSLSHDRVDTLRFSGSPMLRPVERSPEISLFPLPSRKAKRTKKLRTKRGAPPLPYPSYPDALDAPSTSQARSTFAEYTRVSVSPGSPKPKGRSTSATSRETTNGVWSHGSLSPNALAISLVSSPSDEVLSKVNDIVAQGYNMKADGRG